MNPPMKKLGLRVLAAYIPGRGSVDSDDPGGFFQAMALGNQGIAISISPQESHLGTSTVDVDSSFP